MGFSQNGGSSAMSDSFLVSLWTNPTQRTLKNDPRIMTKNLGCEPANAADFRALLLLLA